MLKLNHFVATTKTDVGVAPEALGKVRERLAF